MSIPAQQSAFSQPSYEPAVTYGTTPLRSEYVPPVKPSMSFAPVAAVAKGQRRPMNIVAICLNIFMPWALFSIIYAVMSFSLHYQHPWLVNFILAFGAVLVLIACALAVRAWKKKRDGFSDREPTWFMFAAIALAIALCLAVVFGDINYWYNMQPFYDIENLNTYPSVDPSRDKGQQLMDAGRVYFKDGSRLDISKAMAFKNLDLYCVAPIVVGNQPLTSYDFWAVGVNCCSGAQSDFRCGEYTNPHSKSGLRLMKDEERPFYRLAVQQAESAYQIKAEHPLFFVWMQDPIAAVNQYRDDGFKYYLLGIFTHLAFSIFVVVCAVIAFSKQPGRV